MADVETDFSHVPAFCPLKKNEGNHIYFELFSKLECSRRARVSCQVCISQSLDRGVDPPG